MSLLTVSLLTSCFGPSVISSRFSSLVAPADPPPIPKVAHKIFVGYSSCVLHDQGMDCWGRNDLNQLGMVATSTPIVTPVEIEHGFEVDDFAASDSHSCIIVDGGLKCAGTGTSGQLGHGASSSSATYVDVFPAGSQVSAVSVASQFSCAIKNSGLFCFGAAANYRLGNNNNVLNVNSPLQVFAEGSGVTSVSVANTLVCAVVSGQVWCWGNSADGRLGMGATNLATTPTQIAALGNDNTQIEVGVNHACSVKNGGVYCWGRNWYGFLGNNSLVNSNVPVLAVAQGSGATSVKLGTYHTCALINTEVSCWGSNEYGQMNNAVSLANFLVPTIVFNSSYNIIQISAIDYQTCGMTLDGNVMCWGRGNFGTIEGSSTQWTEPQQVVGLTALVTQMAKFELLNDDSNYQNCVVHNGGVKCWGDNGSGVLGNGSTTASNTPVVAVAEGSGATDVSLVNGTSNASTCAVVNGGVQCWGAGYGLSPLQIIPALSSASAIKVSQYDSFGDDWACAIVDGGVQCWGVNDFGQLGNGNTTASLLAPVTSIPASSGVTHIELAKGTTCAVVNGGLQCWGSNNAGQLGDGSTTNRWSPTTIFAASSGVTDVTIAGDWHDELNSTTCAVVNGGLKCWGYNAAGLVGNGTTNPALSPVVIFPAGTGVTRVFSSQVDICAIKNSGLYCWGANSAGNLGVGDKVSRLTPTVVIPEGSGVTDFDGGSYTSGCAVVSGGLKCWGANWSGEVGDGTILSRLTPVEILPAGSGVQSVRMVYDSVMCAIISGSIKCWGDGYGSSLIGNGVYTRGPMPVHGFD